MLTRALDWLRCRLFPTYWYAVRHKRHRAWLAYLPDERYFEYSYSMEFGPAVWFDDNVEAWIALVANGLRPEEHQLVRLSVRPDSNHYRMHEVSWGCT